MDLLCNAYLTDSDEDGGVNHYHHNSMPENYYPPPAKRPRVANPINPKPIEPQIPGRYISKRERAVMGSAPALAPPVSDSNLYLLPYHPSADSGSISHANIRHDVLESLNHRTKRRTQIPEKLSIPLKGHSKAVNCLQWSSAHPHLLASAGMDHSVRIWNVWNEEETKARVLNNHTAAVKSAKWSTHGLHILSCGYDSSSRLTDVEKGLEIQVFKEEQVVNTVEFHPNNSNLFLSGGSKGLIRLWDIRTGKSVHQYNNNRGLGPILDVEFNNDNSKQFISSCDESKGNVTENAIVVWDVSRQIPLSNQVYAEAYTCPCIKSHPTEAYFVAQSNANYIAIFSAKHPFRLDRYKRFEDHGVSGFPIKCDFSSDGKYLASGSSDGCIYFYEYKNTELIRKMKLYEQSCIDVAFHPVLPNVVAACSWNGDVSVLE